MIRTRSFLLLLLLLPTVAVAQDYHFRKYDVAATGVSLYFPIAPGDFTLSMSEDSSEIYSGSAVTSDSLEWGAIAVKLKHPLAEENKSMILKAYLDYLQEAFDITASAGYGEGHTSDQNPGAIGIIDYWQDNQGNILEVKGWANTHYLCITFVAGKKEIEKNFSSTRFFFNSIKFP